MLKEKTSDAAAGETQTDISIGKGLFVIDTLSVTAGLTTDRAQRVNVRTRHEQSDGTYKDSYIGGGYFTPGIPFVMHNIIFEGPAVIRTTVFHLDSTSHTLTVNYRRYRP